MGHESMSLERMDFQVIKAYPAGVQGDQVYPHIQGSGKSYS